MYRVGMIVPSGNVVMEDLLQMPSGPVRKDMRFHIARVPVGPIDLSQESTDQFNDAVLDQAISHLGDAEVNAIVFGGTAGAWLGVERDRAWCDGVCASTGLPATTTTLQTLALLARDPPSRLGLITPYLEDVHARIAETFAMQGFPVAFGRHLGFSLSHDLSATQPEHIAQLVGACAEAGCDAILTYCTDFRGFEAFQLEPAASASARLIDSAALSFDELPP